MGTNYSVRVKGYEVKLNEARAAREELKAQLDAKRDLFDRDGFTVAWDGLCNLEGEYEELHIGKNSFGWRFIFNSLNYKGLDDFKAKFNSETHVIVDEYGRDIALDALVALVTATLDFEIQPNQKQEKYNEEGFRVYAGEFS